MIFGQKHLTREDVGRRDTRIHFCLIPRRLKCGRWVWLEKVVRSRFVYMGHSDPMLFMFVSPVWSGWCNYSFEQWADMEGEPPARTAYE